MADNFVEEVKKKSCGQEFRVFSAQNKHINKTKTTGNREFSFQIDFSVISLQFFSVNKLLFSFIQLFSNLSEKFNFRLYLNDLCFSSRKAITLCQREGFCICPGIPLRVLLMNMVDLCEFCDLYSNN